MIKKLVGLRQAPKARLSQSYILYDKCDTCPLSVYIDLVCNDNINSLIIKGNPPESALVSAKRDLLIEFSEISGSEHASSTNETLRRYYECHVQLLGLKIALNVYINGDKQKSIDYLKQCGIRVPENDTMKAVKIIQSRIKVKEIKLAQEQKRYEELTKSDTGDKLTSQSFMMQLAVLGESMGFDISTNITLSKYAAYLKLYKEKIKSIKTYGKQ